MAVSDFAKKIQKHFCEPNKTRRVCRISAGGTGRVHVFQTFRSVYKLSTRAYTTYILATHTYIIIVYCYCFGKFYFYDISSDTCSCHARLRTAISRTGRRRTLYARRVYVPTAFYCRPDDGSAVGTGNELLKYRRALATLSVRSKTFETVACLRFTVTFYVRRRTASCRRCTSLLGKRNLA